MLETVISSHSDRIEKNCEEKNCLPWPEESTIKTCVKDSPCKNHNIKPWKIRTEKSLIENERENECSINTFVLMNIIHYQELDPQQSNLDFWVQIGGGVG